jgi:hypothetical protein
VSGSASRFLGRPQRQRRVADDSLLLDEEAEEAFERRRRPRLARERWATLLLLSEEGAQMRHLHLAQVLDPPTLQVIQTRRNVTLVRRARHRCQAPLRSAKAQEIGKFLPLTFLHGSSFGQPSGPRWRDPEDYPAASRAFPTRDAIREAP